MTNQSMGILKVFFISRNSLNNLRVHLTRFDCLQQHHTKGCLNSKGPFINHTCKSICYVDPLSHKTPHFKYRLMWIWAM